MRGRGVTQQLGSPWSLANAAGGRTDGLGLVTTRVAVLGGCRIRGCGFGPSTAECTFA